MLKVYELDDIDDVPNSAHYIPKVFAYYGLGYRPYKKATFLEWLDVYSAFPLFYEHERLEGSHYVKNYVCNHEVLFEVLSCTKYIHESTDFENKIINQPYIFDVKLPKECLYKREEEIEIPPDIIFEMQNNWSIYSGERII